MTINDRVQARIAEAVRRREARRLQRAELDENRGYGLVARHHAKLARDDDQEDDQ